MPGPNILQKAQVLLALQGKACVLENLSPKELDRYCGAALTGCTRPGCDEKSPSIKRNYG
jgi:hypothetical protein